MDPTSVRRHDHGSHTAGTLSIGHRLLTKSWTSEVKALEATLARLAADEPLADNDCRVALFEIVGERELHVNVTHRYETVTVSGWSGPGIVPGGFVHNRRFQHGEPPQKLRLLRKMVFAERRHRDPVRVR